MRKLSNISFAAPVEIVLCAFLALAGSSCVPPSIITDITDNVNIVDDQNIGTVSEGGVAFNVGDEEALPKVDTIIASGPTKQAPDGFLRKVVSVNKSDNGADIKTVPVAIEQAIKEGSIDISKELSIDDLDDSIQKQAKLSSDFDVQVNNAVLYDADGNENTTDDQVVVNGAITVLPAFDLRADIENYNLAYLKFLTKADFEYQLEVSVGQEVSSSNFDKSLELEVYRFKPIVIEIDSIPVVIRPILSLIVGANGQVVGGMKTSGILAGNYQAGAIYQDGEYKPISDFSTDFNADEPTAPGNGRLRVYANMKLKLLVYGAQGFQSILSAYNELIAGGSSALWWKVFGGLRADVDIKTAPISEQVNDYSAGIESYRKILRSTLPQVATPSFSPAAGTFVNSVDVTISCDTAGASIYYTTDGSDPDESSNPYTGAITINDTTTIKARAYKDGMTASDIASATYTIQPPPQVATPSFSPAAGTFVNSVDVTINCDTDGANIYYTTDGSDPDESSNPYTGAFTINDTTIIKARAYKDGMTASDIASATYTIQPPPQVATPSFSPAAGTFVNSVDVTISCDTAGASIYYTTDGSDPDESSNPYTGTITINDTTTIKARAYKDGMTASDIASATYTIQPPPAFAMSAGGSEDDIGRSITHFADGSAVVVGTFSGSAVFGSGQPNQTVLNSAGGTDIFIAKYDSDGQLLWAKGIGSNGGDVATGVSSWPDGSFAVTGYFSDSITFGISETNETRFPAPMGTDIFLAKYSADGTLVWAVAAFGSESENISNAVVALPDGSSVIVGAFSYYIIFGQGTSNEISFTTDYSADIFVARYDANGIPLWAVQEGAYYGDDQANGVAYSNGNILVTGYFQESGVFDGSSGTTPTVLSSAGGKDIFVAKYDYLGGALLWAKRAGGESDDVGYSVTAFSDGSSAVTGSFSSSAVFGPCENYATTLTSTGADDIFVARYNGNGTLYWVKQAGGAGVDIGLGISHLSDGSLAVIGKFSTSAIFGSGESNQTTILSSGSNDIFLARFDGDSGSLLWAKQTGESSVADSGYGLTIAAESNDQITTTGYFTSSITFGTGEANETTLTSSGGKDVFVARYNSDGTLSNVGTGGNAITTR